MTDHILLVEDDEELAQALGAFLETRGFRVSRAHDGDRASEELARARPDLCLLDIMLPKKDGFVLAGEIREQHPSLPIVFLTARSLKEDELQGFEVGADDYLIKPIDEDVMVARIEALLRRIRGDSETRRREKVQLGRFVFEPGERRLTLGGETRRLTARESDLLDLLDSCRNRLLPRDEALIRLWGGSDYFKRKSMDVFISRLRKHLRPDPALRIVNVHGRGFILEVDETSPTQRAKCPPNREY